MRPRKIIVAIPTYNREVKYLNATVRSVANQASAFGHDVEIVVSDMSSEKTRADANRKVIEKLVTEFASHGNIKFHYYGPELPEPVRLLLEKSSEGEKSDYHAHVPKDSARGAHRNRLALLAVYHGGKQAAYLHLDDDTPLLTLDNEKMVRTNEVDVLGAFLSGFEQAIARDKPGASGAVFGVRDSAVSAYDADAYTKIIPSKRSSETNLGRNLSRLHNMNVHPAGHRSGPGRILSYDAMLKHYRPNVYEEDRIHSRLVAPKGYHPAPPEATCLHIGTTGSNPPRPTRYGNRVIENDSRPWENLVRKITLLGDQRFHRE